MVNQKSDIGRDTEKTKKILIIVIIAIVAVIVIVVLVFLLFPNGGGIFKTSGGSITRGFSSTQVSPEETFTVNYNIVLNSGQRYYLFEDAVPAGFEIIDCRHNDKNKIKIIDIENPESKIQECTLKAPSTSESYTFSGEYVFEGLDEPVKIEGASSITVQ